MTTEATAQGGDTIRIYSRERLRLLAIKHQLEAREGRILSMAKVLRLVLDGYERAQRQRR